MGSRLKLVLILLFIGGAGILFWMQKKVEEREVSGNFLEEVTFSENISREEEEKKSEKVEKLKKEDEVKSSDTIFVHVCGAVKEEGVYELPEGSRVVDAIKKAGGFQKKASKKDINQAELLSDGIQVYIPFREEMNKEEKEVQAKSGKVNINKASKEELMTLPGIGESRAEAILNFRKENGRFKEISDIMKVSGIKQNAFDKIKDKITV